MERTMKSEEKEKEKQLRWKFKTQFAKSERDEVLERSDIRKLSTGFEWPILIRLLK